MRVAGREGVESKAQILSSSWYDQYLCSYTETVFLVIEISHSYIIFEKNNNNNKGNVTVISQRFQAQFHENRTTAKANDYYQNAKLFAFDNTWENDPKYDVYFMSHQH